MSSRFPTKPKDIPDEPSYAILRPTSTTQDGGHGYGVYTTDYWNIEIFESKEKWEKEIKRLSSLRNGDEFKAVKIIPANIEITIQVDIDPRKDAKPKRGISFS